MNSFTEDNERTQTQKQIIIAKKKGTTLLINCLTIIMANL